MNPIVRGVRNAFRNGIRTCSIIVILGASIALALSMLLANHAVKAKMDTLRTSLGNTLLVRPAGSEGFQGGGEPLTTAQADKLKGLNHVTSVSKTNMLIAQKETDGQTGGTLKMRGPGGASVGSVSTNLESALELGTLGRRFQSSAVDENGKEATPPPPPVQVEGIEGDTNSAGNAIKLTEGRQLTASDTTSALVSTEVAKKNNLKLGSTFTLKDTTFTVVGIFDAGTKFGNNGIKIPFAKAAELAGHANEVSTVVVKVDSLENVEAVQSAIKDTLGSNVADVNASDPSAQNAIQSLRTVEKISMVGFFASLGAAAAVIFLTMLMIVRERRREIGVLKAIGAKTHKIVVQFMAEAVTLAVLAAGVGFGLALVMSNTVLHTLVNSNVITEGTEGMGRMGGPRMMGPEGVKDAASTAKDLVGTLQLSLIHI